MTSVPRWASASGANCAATVSSAPRRPQSEEEQTVYARIREAYAGVLEQTDAQIGQLVDYLKEMDGTRMLRSS